MISKNQVTCTEPGRKIRLAVIVSHPIQYYVPLYRRLAARSDLSIKVFFTWHSANREVWDHGFRQKVAWDIPLTDGYDFDLVPNAASKPGTNHFRGLQNPTLVDDVAGWKPDAVHLTGYNYASHLHALISLSRRGVPVLFRGDSTLLDHSGPLKRLMKNLALTRIFKYPAAFLCVGENNRNYYRHYGVPESKLFDCPHSIEFERFAEPHEYLEHQAAEWRRSLEIRPDHTVLLFAGKFEPKKQPIELMQAILKLSDPKLVLIMIGDGELKQGVQALASSHPSTFRLLPFQNQSVMPVVYRLGDLLILPSVFGETWGLAANEAMASKRPVLISDKVGCAPDVVSSGENGDVFRANDWLDFASKLRNLTSGPERLRGMRTTAQHFARKFATPATELGVVRAVYFATALNNDVTTYK
jgi:glycosyltransferase involved in cell wall biosynthesis